ncbi:hypothetical protein QF028_000037 [Neobacillus sp. B4I6]|uniref:hypothetical protein n=1 Tax=Neobacillus sp. B4I6 TaxID=3373925 RepID=UPI003D1B2650
MDKNLAYSSLYLYHAKELKLSEVSARVGLNERVIRAIVKGVRMPEVCNDFFADRKSGDYNRTYPKPEYNKMSKADYIALESRYMSIVYKGLVSLNEVRSYLLEDDVEPTQAYKLFKSLEVF